MSERTLEVELLQYHGEDLDLSLGGAWEIALDQRAFGCGRLLVFTGDCHGRVLELAHCRLVDPPLLALHACLDMFVGADAVAAVAYSDEQFNSGLIDEDLAARFFDARALAADHGLHLIDWILCDETQFRTLKFSLIEGAEWWDLPSTAA